MPWLLIVSAALLPSPPREEFSRSQDASRDEVKRAVQDVLSSRDYDQRRFSPTLAQKLWEKIKKWFEGLGRLWNTSPALAWAVIGICSALLLAIAAHFLLILYRSTRSVKEAREGRGLKLLKEDPRVLLERARKADNVIAALTLYVMAAIAGLDRRGIVRLTETATVREYRGFLRARPTDAASFDRLLSYYEPGVFGRKPVPPDAVKECDRAAARLIGGEA